MTSMIPHSVDRRALRAGLVPEFTVEKRRLLAECWRCLGPGGSLSFCVRDTCGYEIGSCAERPREILAIKVETPSQTEIMIKGIDKQKVGQVAAEVRAYRSPEPYKGKGVRYFGEKVVLKETKKK